MSAEGAVAAQQQKSQDGLPDIGLIHWDELQYCALASRTSLYGLTQLSTGGEHRLLVSCLQAKVLSVVSQQNKLPSAQQLAFTYIASNAEIISIDAFSRSHSDSLHTDSAPSTGVVVAIAFTKTTEMGTERNSYLNIYCEWEKGYEADLERVSEGCQSLALDFMPYQLYHTRIGHSTGETVFLLSGSDHRIHLFKEARNTHMFVQYPVDDYFPEMSNIESVVVCMQCLYKGENRFTALGCQNGVVQFSITNIHSNETQSYVVQHDSPISSVRIFHSSSNSCDSWQQSYSQQLNSSDSAQTDDLSVLVCPTLESSLVYTQVHTQGLTELTTLQDSDSADCVISSLVADVDCDGCNEIILGTYGQELLIYKLMPSNRTTMDGSACRTSISERLHAAATPHTSATAADLTTCSSPVAATDMTTSTTDNSFNATVAASNADADTISNANAATDLAQSAANLSAHNSHSPPSADRITPANQKSSCNAPVNTSANQQPAHNDSEPIVATSRAEYELIRRRVMPDPVLGLLYEDVMGDGVRELIVLSLNGLHILQHDVHTVMRVIEKRLRDLVYNT